MLRRLRRPFIGNFAATLTGSFMHSAEDSCSHGSFFYVFFVMTSHQYEVALFAEFFSKDLQPILNRITLHCESAEPMHSREVVFEPIDVHGNRDQAILRARKELIVNGKNVDGPWCREIVQGSSSTLTTPAPGISTPTSSPSPCVSTQRLPLGPGQLSKSRGML